MKLISLAIILFTLTESAFGVQSVKAQVCDPSLSFAPASPTVGSTVTFTALPCGTSPFFLDWNFGDGATGAGGTLTHIFQATGSYSVILMITDAQGITSVANLQVNVVEAQFELRVSPASQQVPLSGVGAYNIQTVPGHNFATNVTIAVSFSGPQKALGCSYFSPISAYSFAKFEKVFSCDNVSSNNETISSGQPVTLYISPQPPLQPGGTYTLIVHATPCNSKHPCSPNSSTVTRDVTFTVTKLTGIRNVITFSDVSISDSGGAIVSCALNLGDLFLGGCFSIQQNFYVSLPGEEHEYSYWAQNVLLIGLPLGPETSLDALSIYNIFPYGCKGLPCLIFGGYPAFSHSSICVSICESQVTLTSNITDDKLILSSDFNTFTIPLNVKGGYITRVGVFDSQPQLDIVGGGTCLICGPPTVTFASPTSGKVQSYVQLDSGSWSSLVTQTLLNCPNPCPDRTGYNGSPTGESSRNLGWNLSPNQGNHAGFSYDDGINVTGVAFAPATGVATALVAGGSASTSDSASNVFVKIEGASPNGRAIVISSSVVTDPPAGTGGLIFPSVGFYDVRVAGVSSGTATICITTPNIGSSDSRLEYFDNATKEWKFASNSFVFFSSQATVCGDIPVASLQGTLIAIGDPAAHVALPVTTVSLASSPSHDGWYTTPAVDATFTSAETSGVRIADITVSLDGQQTIFSGSRATVTVSGEGTHSLVYNASDNNGNKEDPKTLVLKIDSVPPSVLGALNRSADHNGWYNHQLNVSWSGTDTTSGVSSCDSAFLYTGPNTGGVALTGSCFDDAGNVGTSYVTLRYDSTPPAISSPQDGKSFTLRQTVLANATCSDSLAGIDTCVVPTFVDTTTVGAHSYDVSSTDLAGNSNSSTVHYNVHYVFVTVSPKPSDTRFQLGRTIPVRFQLTDALANFVSAATAQIWVDSLTNPGKSSGSANTGNYFRYDFTQNQYIFNLSTTSMTVGEHTIYITLEDGTTHLVTVNLSSR